jgi:HAD superfamily hydrolase (TIGR01509 family)
MNAFQRDPMLPAKPLTVATLATSQDGGRRLETGNAVRGLVLDAPGLLFDDSLWRRWLLKLLMHMGLHTHYDVFYRTWDYEFASDVQAGRCKWHDALEKFLLSAGLSRAQIDEIIPALRAQRKQFESNLRPMPGVVETLQSLRQQQYRIAFTADTTSTVAELVGQLDRLGLYSSSDSVISSIDIGHAMPEAAAYIAALIVLDLRPDEVAFVSSLPVHLVGAKRFGMNVVAVDCELVAEADVHFEQFSQLIHCLSESTHGQQRRVG